MAQPQIAQEPQPGNPFKEQLRWLREFERKNGRPLRVLHVGNIANNAYNNGKIQRQRGIEADVICYDYYHIMGCPEWEDADFEGDVGDPFWPDWWAVDLRGFKRPRWFVQGPLVACRKYLIQKNQGHRLRMQFYWRSLEIVRWCECRRTFPAHLARLVMKPVAFIVHARNSGLYLARRAMWILSFYLSWGVRRLSTGVKRLPWGIKCPSWVPRFSGAMGIGASVLAKCRWLYGSMREALGRATKLLWREELKRIEAHFCHMYSHYFSDRSDRLILFELRPYFAGIRSWRKVFAHYDIIQAYSTDAVIPILCGLRNYAVYEHGTIREIPFEDTVRGRVCALSYREAPIVFITNADNLYAADKLGIEEDRIVCLPHAFDSDKLERFADDNPNLEPPPDGPIVFFSPTRQHWVDNDPSWAKGNDRVIKALRIVVDRRMKCRLVLVEWGRDVEATKAHVRDLGLEDYVRWVPMMKKRELWARYLTSHAVLDQFLVPSIGGVTFEAMALGRRVITAIDIPVNGRFFGAPPPLFVCETPEEIADSMATVIRDPMDKAGRGVAARVWIDKHHSADRVVALQLTAYRRLLAPARPNRGTTDDRSSESGSRAV